MESTALAIGFSMFGLVRADEPVTFLVSQVDIRHGINSKFSPAIVSSLSLAHFPKCNWVS